MHPKPHLTQNPTCGGANSGEEDDCHPNDADADHQECGVYGPRHRVYRHRGNLPRGAEGECEVILAHE